MSVAKRILGSKRVKSESLKGVRVQIVDGQIFLYACKSGKPGAKKRRREDREALGEAKGRPEADVMLIEKGPRGIPYSVYLETTHWKKIRRGTLQRDKRRCVRCKRKKATQVHHLTYERLGGEEPQDVVSLCGACHTLVHEKNVTLVPPKAKKKKERRDTSEGDRARELCRKVRWAIKGRRYVDPEVLRILEVWEKKTALQGEISVKRAMREMGYLF